MQLRTVAWLSMLGMLLCSLIAGWLATPTRAARAESAEGLPAEPSAAPASVELAGTIALEARVGHAVVAPGAAKTYLYFRAKAGGARSEAGSLHAVVLLDRSGSMRGRRLANALAAARSFVGRLRDGDRVTVMTYDANVATLVPTTRIDSGARARVLANIRDAAALGSTCISCALEAGLRELEHSSSQLRHVLLLSDGEATAGERTPEAFRRLARRAREAGVGISSIGVDVDYNEALLASLAQLSNGRHHFVRDSRDLDRAFDRELETLADPVATNVVLEVALAPGIELIDVFDREVERAADRLRIRLGAFARGDEKTALLEVRLPASKPGRIGAADFAFDYDTVGEKTSPQSVTGSVGLRIGADAKEASSLDLVVAARIGASKTGAVLFEAGKLFKSGSSRDFVELERKLGAEIERVHRDRATATESGATSASRALSQQGTALESARNKLRVTRGVRCGCAPGDLMCAMRCSADSPATSSRTDGELSDDEKAAAKDAVGSSNPFKE